MRPSGWRRPWKPRLSQSPGTGPIWAAPGSRWSVAKLSRLPRPAQERRGGPPWARAAVQEAVAAFQATGMVLRELDSRLLLADIHLREDQAGAAEREFRHVL